MRMLTDLQAGIERGEFRLAYQPVVDLTSGCAAGFEALLRWDHPLYGSIPPAHVHPLAEESGAIVELGRFALRKACIDAGEPPAWTDRAAADDERQPRRQAIDGIGHRQGRRARARRKRPAPELLILEITESALLEEGPARERGALAIARSGVRLCIDDFGTGYSSLRYLHQFPIDSLKIDRSFVSGRDGGIANEPIVQMVVTLAHALGMDVIAEGVESQCNAKNYSPRAARSAKDSTSRARSIVTKKSIAG
jgi:EAL domain-containing protein (putative c-di-GMP-specific phosphodiesterase class I)